MSHNSRLTTLPLLLSSCLALAIAAQDATPGTRITFQKFQLDANFRSEGVAVADFNRDGRLDIAAGFVWYAAPDWKMHVIAAKPPGPPGPGGC